MEAMDRGPRAHRSPRGAIEGITTSMVQPAGLSNRTPSLRVMWPRQHFGVTGEELARTLFTTDPRIALFPAAARAIPP
jgi:L-seryl-tRNA(Ser) seleniumtransferase